MSTTAAPSASAVGVFQHQAKVTRTVVGMNLEGMTHQESLAEPRPHGNRPNWVLGHLTCVYNNFLPMVGQQPVVEKSVLERYDRGSAPIDPAHALDLDELRRIWDAVAECVEAGLATLDPDSLDRPSPFSPSNNPDETVGSLISTVMFHQAYHAGQLGILRRVAGMEGAIK